MPQPPTPNPNDNWYADSERLVNVSGVAASYRIDCVRLLRRLPAKLGPWTREALAGELLSHVRSRRIRGRDDLAFLRETFEGTRAELLLRYLAGPVMRVDELRELVLYAELTDLVETLVRLQRNEGGATPPPKLFMDALAFQVALVRDAELRARRAQKRHAPHPTEATSAS